MFITKTEFVIKIQFTLKIILSYDKFFLGATITVGG